MTPRNLLVIVVACLAFAAVGGFWFVKQRPAAVHTAARIAGRPQPRPEAAPPLPPILKADLMPLSAQEAQAINAGLAISTAPVQAARPFFLKMNAMVRDDVLAADGLENRNLALDCLTTAVYYEAASESDQGERAVAQVVLNRVRHPAFPKSVCGVVYEGAERTTGCQFTFTCDGSLARQPSQSGWARARRIALAALNGAVESTVGTATHYHADWVVPYWAPSLDKVTTIGAHIFYRWKGYWGQRAAFSGAYAGEPVGGHFPAMPYELTRGPTDLVTDEKPLSDRTRLLADQVDYAGPRHEMVTPRASALRADQGRGALVADQNGGTLDESHLGSKVRDRALP